MDTFIELDCESWSCQSTLQTMVIDILWRIGIHNEVRAFDDSVSILDTDSSEHELIKEYILINLPRT